MAAVAADPVDELAPVRDVRGQLAARLEARLVGGVLAHGADCVRGLVGPEDVRDALYAAALRLALERPTDEVLAAEALVGSGFPSAYGLIADLVQLAPVPSAMPHYARRVARIAALRRAVEAVEGIADRIRTHGEGATADEEAGLVADVLRGTTLSAAELGAVFRRVLEGDGRLPPRTEGC